jgi:pyrimidine-nucleoside phosphorylase
LGVICSKIGAGREKAGDIVSYEVGMRLKKTFGDMIEAGEEWLHVYSNSQDFDKNYGERIDQTIEIVNEPIENESLVVKIIDFM